MALIACPECAKQISDTAPSCPQCGYLFSSTVKVQERVTTPLINTTPNAPPTSTTPIEELKRNLGAGCAAIVAGIAITLVGLILFSIWIISIPALISGFLLFGYGINLMSGMHNIACPYCNASGKLQKSAMKYKCHACRKISVVSGSNLRTTL